MEKEINKKVRDLDMRKRRQYLGNIYVWLYQNKNELAYGINGTSKHFLIKGYKDLTKEEIINIIFENCGGYNEK